MEIFLQAPAKLVFLFNAVPTKEILLALKKHKFCQLNGENKNLLDAFYGHTKPTLAESVMVIETKTLSSCFLAAKSACEDSNITVLEIDSGRSLNGTAIAFLTGPQFNCEKFKSKNKIKNISIEVLSQMPKSISSLWERV